MRSMTRYIALGLAGVMLAACGNKDKDAPLAFVPADTPYVVANLDVLDDSTRTALLAQANAQLPSQMAQIEAAADSLEAEDPDGARLLRALHKEFNGKTIEAFAKDAGMDLKGYSAFYGLGLSPVMRFQLTDVKAFDAFIARLETAYGKKLDAANMDKQAYRKYVFPASGTQVILATVDEQAVAALLPADAPDTMLRQALGLDRPSKSLQDDGRLATLAKDKGYEKWMVGQIDLTRVLPLAMGGKDPLVAAMRKARAEAISAETGEPVANQLQDSPECQTDAARIAARVPSISMGYTKLNTKHQNARVDVALAPDITKAFANIKVELPGLGKGSTAPFDLAMAFPVSTLRTFWMAQAEAVAAKPFACPALAEMNEGFAQIGPTMQKAAIPPFGDILGLRVIVDSLAPGADASAMPTFAGRVVLATSNPEGLLAMGQMMVPALTQLKPGTDGKPVALPADMTGMIGQPAWVAMGEKSLALGIGAGADAKLNETLKDAPGGAGQMSRMHLSGDMYVTWIELMQQKLGAVTASMGDTKDQERTMEQFATMKAQAERVESIDAEVHVEKEGMVITTQMQMK